MQANNCSRFPFRHLYLYLMLYKAFSLLYTYSRKQYTVETSKLSGRYSETRNKYLVFFPLFNCVQRMANYRMASHICRGSYGSIYIFAVLELRNDLMEVNGYDQHTLQPCYLVFFENYIRSPTGHKATSCSDFRRVLRYFMCLTEITKNNYSCENKQRDGIV